MNIIPTLSVPFYEFEAYHGLNEKVLNDLQSKTWSKADRPEYGQIIPNYYNEELFQFFNDSIDKFKNTYFEERLTFPIVDCWANKYTKLTRLKKHSHSNAIICGLYYVTTHSDANTVWEMSNPWTERVCEGTALWITKKNFNHNLKVEISPKEGTLILFPPQFYHYMNTYSDHTTPRYTIAFNCFVSGEISKIKTGSLTLQSK